MNFVLLTIATVLTGAPIAVELAFEFRSLGPLMEDQTRPKQRRMRNSMMNTKKCRERNPYLLTGKKRWRLFRWGASSVGSVSSPSKE
jgi:hypothetical protein